MSSWDGRLAFRFEFSPTLNAFASIARGHRPQALLLDSITTTAVDEEEVVNDEVGLQGRLAENLFDRAYLIDAGNVRSSFGIPTYIAGDPRRFRVQAGVRW